MATEGLFNGLLASTRGDPAMSNDRNAPVEIERKFLVTGDAWRDGAVGQQIRQGYLGRSDAAVIRVRICEQEAFLTVKGRQVGITCPEFEYEIPIDEAAAMLTLVSGRLIEKTRYKVEYRGHTWEVDVFEGENQGLILAEIELGSEDELFALPSWAGREVSRDPRFKNSQLSLEPFPGRTGAEATETLDT